MGARRKLIASVVLLLVGTALFVVGLAFAGVVAAGLIVSGGIVAAIGLEMDTSEPKEARR